MMQDLGYKIQEASHYFNVTYW